MRDILFRYEWVLPFIGGVLFGIVWGAERRLRLVCQLALVRAGLDRAWAERDMAEQERDELACSMVAGMDGGRFEESTPDLSVPGWVEIAGEWRWIGPGRPQTVSRG